MATSLTVPRILSYPPAMDYQLLRREGLTHLERLGSANWTDFNTHDPGITMLEVLCYGLTDLGYRAELPDADLFAAGAGQKSFFTAAESLPNAAVTATDFRKLLIDIEGVKNAWLKAGGREKVSVQLNLAARIEVPLSGRLGEYVAAFAPDVRALPALSFRQGADSPWATIVALEHAGAGLKIFKKDLETLDSAGIRASITGLVDELARFPESTTAGEIIAILNRIDEDAEEGEIRKLLDEAGCELDLNDAISGFFEDGLAPDAVPAGTQWKALVLYLIEAHFAAIEKWARKQFGPGFFPPASPGFLEQLRQLHQELSTYWAQPEGQRGELLSWDGFAAMSVVQNEFKKAFVLPFLFGILFKNSLLVAENEDDMVSLFVPRGVYRVYIQPEEGYQHQAEELRQKALGVLHASRALGEDFDPAIRIIENVGMGLEAVIEIVPGADLAEVYAALRYAVDDFLSPAVTMYSLQEMMDQYATYTFSDHVFETLSDTNLPAALLTALEPLRNQLLIGSVSLDAALAALLTSSELEEYGSMLHSAVAVAYEAGEVFQGPLLTHGFIEDAALENAGWRRTVYLSDLFQVMSAVPGVVRVQKLVMNRCGDEHPVRTPWCLHFDCDCQPAVDWEGDCSQIRFTKGGRAVTPGESLLWEVQDRLQQLRAKNAKIDRSGALDLPLPAGRRRDDLAEYTSVQEEFPRTYHVGREGIASGEPALRKAQVKQLKGFLLVFDQLMANYLSQLTQVSEALSIQKTGEPLQAYQALYDIPFVKTLFTALDPDASWDNFRSDPGNAYMRSLDKLVNGSAVNVQLRQNQLLDHLLARFGESFMEDVLSMFDIERPLEAGSEDGLKDWLADKQRMLENIPLLAGRRGCAFNYRAPREAGNTHFWDSENVEGFRRRVLAQLGVSNWRRGTISFMPRFTLDTRLEMAGKARRYRFGIKPEEGSAGFWLLSRALFSQLENAEKEADKFLSQATGTDHYGIVRDDEQRFVVGFWKNQFSDPAGTFIPQVENAWLLSERFDNEEDAGALLRKITETTGDQAGSDNFHVVEHILLRPLDKDYLVLLPDVLQTGFESADAYSFQVTIVVPSWAERFREPARYAYFQQLVRQELPAHIHPRFVSLGRAAMVRFEEDMYTWLSLLSDPSAERFELRKAANTMISLLNQYEYDSFN
ncbi:hypothetical protein [Dyadobacter sandarakinus]|uniref:Uncharacterized protein n=1 Tax=Dyadobacter sandarakinus TaxID=2747268 RepID=A0ABX7I6K1_9BACT|nr:hypothetical protein [Dyadobacter sandarakinus]QRR00606.1 hypothetical protein HWI92_06640 [Dyadobacter sandarakinus]